MKTLTTNRTIPGSVWARLSAGARREREALARSRRSRRASSACASLLVLTAVLTLSACALAPRESVELSTTVGQDVVSVRESHRELGQTLFGRMKGDVNRFVDEVYAPHQIQVVLASQRERQLQGGGNDIFSALEQALKRPEDSQAQKDVLDMMQAIVELLREDVEQFRADRLKPVLLREQQVMEEIETAYDRILRGNATVTAHLASIVKVHDVQDELLKSANLEALRVKTGTRLSEISTQVSEFVQKAERLDGSVDSATTKIQELTHRLDSLVEGG